MTKYEKETARLCDKELFKHMKDKNSYNLVDSTTYICQSCGKKIKRITNEYGKMPIAMWILQQGITQSLSNDNFLIISPEQCSCGGILKSTAISLQDKVSNKVFRTLRPQISISLIANEKEEKFDLSKHAEFISSTDFNNKNFAQRCILFANIIFKNVKCSKIVETFTTIKPDSFHSIKNSTHNDLILFFNSLSYEEQIDFFINLNKAFFSKNLYKIMPRNILEMLYNEKDYKSNVKELCSDFRYVLFFEMIASPKCLSADYALIIATIMNKFINTLDDQDYIDLHLFNPELFKLCDAAYSAEYYKSMSENMLLQIRKTENQINLLTEENIILKEKLKKEETRETIIENRSKDDINKIKELKSIINALKSEIEILKENTN